MYTLTIDEVSQIPGEDTFAAWGTVLDENMQFDSGIMGYGATVGDALTRLRDEFAEIVAPPEALEIDVPVAPDYTFTPLPVAGALGADHDYLGVLP